MSIGMRFFSCALALAVSLAASHPARAGEMGVALVEQVSTSSPKWSSIPENRGNQRNPEFVRAAFTEQEAVKFLERKVLDGGSVPSALVLYVHGRGKEPTKSMQAGNLLARIAPGKDEPVVTKLLQDGKKAVMFHWYRSAPGVWQYYPRQEAESAGAHLGTLLKAWAKVKKNLPDRYSRMPCVLLCHSMGNIVLQEMIQKGWSPRIPGLIDTLLCSSPDVSAVGHEQWLGRAFEFSRQVVVTNKAGDGILKLSRRKNEQAARLGDVGRENDRLAIHPSAPASQLPLVPRVIYADLNQIEFKGWEHRYVFTQSPGSVKVFFAAALSGKDVMKHLQKGRVRESQVQGATRLLFLP